MKKIPLLALALALCGIVQVSGQVLTGFGTSETNPYETGTPGFWTVSQSTTSISVSGAPANSEGLYSALETPISVSNIGTKFLTLTAAVTAASVSPFDITIFDTSANQNTLTYSFNFLNYVSLGQGNPGIEYSGLLTDPGDVAAFGKVGSYELDPGGLPSSTVSARFDELQFTTTFVPEPSTYAMFGFGLFMLYFVYRRKADKLQTVRA